MSIIFLLVVFHLMLEALSAHGYVPANFVFIVDYDTGRDIFRICSNMAFVIIGVTYRLGGTRHRLLQLQVQPYKRGCCTENKNGKYTKT